jgi:recombination protein RecR
VQTIAEPVSRLIDEFSRLPGIGPKTASRLTFYLLRAPKEQALALADALRELKERTVFCSICFNITETSPCPICRDEGRDRSIICVVEEPLDVLAIERTREY